MGKVIRYIYCLLFLICFQIKGFCQPGTTVDLKKPAKYENRVLTSEKTGNKKFSFPKRVTQNAFSHYNYYFNANNLLNDIIDDAKKVFKDDYTTLLPFNSYSLDATAGSGNIDSVIYKCNAGILLHDLRSNWVDNLYLALGKAYFLRKNFDSAEQVFRYINYAFAPKEAGGYDIPVGSNVSATDATFSIATKEKSSFPKKLISTPPSRNDALLWSARNYLESDKTAEAGGILEILRNDPFFPSRLKSDLEELVAYWYYQQNLYDSSAGHLIKALGVADDKLDKARMEFLAAQLYGMAGNKEESIKWFGKSAEQTIDPIMEVYANLSSIRIAGGNSDSITTQKLNALLKMAHRDKYLSSKDIIYYAIAQVELERNNAAEAQVMLKKSIFYNTDDNRDQRSQSFLLLADINFDLQKYEAAYNFYDSVNAASIPSETDKQRMAERKTALEVITQNIGTIHEQDSLQTVAMMPKNERDALIKKAVRFYRKQQGLKEDDTEPNVNPAIQQTATVDIFNTAGKSDWYFNNISLKGTGFSQFKIKWGNRPNTDNWQRQAAITAQLAAEQAEDDSSDTDDGDNAREKLNLPRPKAGVPAPDNKQSTLANEDGEITYEALLANLPLTEEQIIASNDKIADALFSNGQAFQNMLEDYPSAINAYEQFLKKYPDNKNSEAALFSLYYCYTKTGRNFSADSVRNAMAKNFPDGLMTAKLNNAKANTKEENAPATREYKSIYNLFIEGKFEQAKNAKAKADSTWGSKYWTPQLLYIESVFYVSKKEDSTAINRLNNLVTLYPQTPLAEKATAMIDVLGRRSEIEDYLTKLQITRNDKEEPEPVVDLTPVKPTIARTVIKRDSVVNKPTSQIAKTTIDTATGKPVIIKSFEFNAKDPQFVVLILDKVDPVFINEAKNALSRYNQINFYNQKLALSPVKLDDRYNLVLAGPFADAVAAIDYVDKTKPLAPSRIIPWLAPEKYNFTIISQSNLDILKQSRDVDSYKQLMEKILPGKF